MELILNYMLISIIGLCGWLYAIAAFIIIATVIDKVANLVLKIIMSIIGYVKKTKLFRKTQEIK